MPKIVFYLGGKLLLFLFPVGVIVSFSQELDLPEVAKHFDDGQRVTFWVGCYMVVTSQIVAAVYFSSVWIKGGYMNSGTGKREKDKSLELSEVSILRKDVLIFQSFTLFTAICFTIPLLSKINVYPMAVLWIVGTGAFGTTILGLIERGKALFKKKSKPGMEVDFTSRETEETLKIETEE